MPHIRTPRPARLSQATARLSSRAPARLSQEEAARRRAMLLHPSNFKPSPSPGSDAGARAQELSSRFKYLHEDLVCRGLPGNQARTEVARIAAREVWDGFASQLRRHRAAGRQMDANVLAVALTSIQGMTLALLRHQGDLSYAGRAVSTALRRLQYNGGLLDRLHPHGSPAFKDATVTLQSLEAFLSHRQAESS
ncbi:hypothetical protein [Arthrobacter sp. B1I2]|uniref:hypothetical protein n=1 Tax=Arthrobacter sp. B1I2 TaxID=3042263 RepID=UPI0027849280|nr:hypothetical protein [Arthrobacter sp. B1I2]MDQ0733031.1 hypothetical protein [Arthrobacter sp. B1I2]